MTRDPVAYLAGPEVFLPNAHEIGRAKIAICRAHGLDAEFPFVPPDETATMTAQRGHEIFELCIAMMDRCDLAIANMTPFRGVSMDAGTAVEVGYMFARGRPVFGYTNATADYNERVSGDSWTVESFGFADNLMCEGPVWRSGASIVRTDVDDDVRLTDLRGFTACVEQAAALVRAPQSSS